MPRIKVNREKCKGCLLCISVCPKGQLKQDGHLNKKGINPILFTGGGCTACAFCALICPDMAIEVYK